MKVTISYQVDFEDVPKKIKQLVNNLLADDYNDISGSLSAISFHISNKRYSEAIEGIDVVRQSLANLDQGLMDYSDILTGYVKADADVRSGIPEQELFSSPQTQEVSAENILDEKKEND